MYSSQEGIFVVQESGRMKGRSSRSFAALLAPFLKVVSTAQNLWLSLSSL